MTIVSQFKDGGILYHKISSTESSKPSCFMRQDVWDTLLKSQEAFSFYDEEGVHWLAYSDGKHAMVESDGGHQMTFQVNDNPLQKSFGKKDETKLTKKKMINKRGILTTVLFDPFKDEVKEKAHAVVEKIHGLIKKAGIGQRIKGEHVAVERHGDDEYSLHTPDGHSLHEGTFSALEAANHIRSIAADEKYREKVHAHAKARSKGSNSLKDVIHRLVQRMSFADAVQPKHKEELAHIIKELEKGGHTKEAQYLTKLSRNKGATPGEYASALGSVILRDDGKLSKAKDSRSPALQLAARIGTAVDTLKKAFPRVKFDAASSPADAALSLLDHLRERYDRSKNAAKKTKAQDSPKKDPAPKAPSSEKKATSERKPKEKFPYSRDQMRALVHTLVDVAGLQGEHAKGYTDMFSDAPKPSKEGSQGPGKLANVLSKEEHEGLKDTQVSVPIELVTQVDAGEPYTIRGHTIQKVGRFVDVKSPDGTTRRMPGALPDSIDTAFKYVKSQFIRKQKEGYDLGAATGDFMARFKTTNIGKDASRAGKIEKEGALGIEAMSALEANKLPSQGSVTIPEKIADPKEGETPGEGLKRHGITVSGSAIIDSSGKTLMRNYPVEWGTKLLSNMNKESTHEGRRAALIEAVSDFKSIKHASIESRARSAENALKEKPRSKKLQEEYAMAQDAVKSSKEEIRNLKDEASSLRGAARPTLKSDSPMAKQTEKKEPTPPPKMKQSDEEKKKKDKEYREKKAREEVAKKSPQAPPEVAEAMAKLLAKKPHMKLGDDKKTSPKAKGPEKSSIAKVREAKQKLDEISKSGGTAKDVSDAKSALMSARLNLKKELEKETPAENSAGKVPVQPYQHYEERVLEAASVLGVDITGWDKQKQHLQRAHSNGEPVYMAVSELKQRLEGEKVAQGIADDGKKLIGAKDPEGAQYKAGQKLKLKGQGLSTYVGMENGKHKIKNKNGLPLLVSDAWLKEHTK